MTTKASSSKVSTLIASLALILALLACAALGLGWKKLQETQQTQQKQLTASLQEIEDKNQQFTKSEMTTVNSQLTALEKTIQQQNTVPSIQSYFLLEATYLSQQAMLNLAFGRDVPAAIALLQAADKRLQATQDLTFYKLRQSLADNIIALQAVPSVDIEGLLTRLNALQKQVEQLPLFSVPKPEPGAPKSATLLTTEKEWRKALRESWEALQKVVIIRHREQPIGPLLPPDQETYLRQNLRLVLQQAQWAVLHNQANIYRISLQQATEWIQHYFANNEPSTQAMLKSLIELQKINIRPELPDLGPMVQLFTQSTLPKPARKSAPETNPS